MDDLKVLEKFKTLQDTNMVVFGYRYIRQKVEDFISISNLRLEVLQSYNGKVMLSSAAPVLDITHSKGKISFCDKDICCITDGRRANIVLRTKFLKEGEEAAPVSYCYANELTEDSPIEQLRRAVLFSSTPAYPGIDMRVPEFYRCSKNPERFRLHFNKGLVDALKGPDEMIKDAEALKRLFMKNIDSLAIRTEEGYVVPFDWIYAGGMVVADAKYIGKSKPLNLYIRSNDFFRNWVSAKGWSMTTL